MKKKDRDDMFFRGEFPEYRTSIEEVEAARKIKTNRVEVATHTSKPNKEETITCNHCKHIIHSCTSRTMNVDLYVCDKCGWDNFVVKKA